MDTQNKKNVTLDDLAAAMQAGFKGAKEDNESLAAMVSTGFDGVNQRFDKVEGEIQDLKGEMQGLQNEMQGLRSSVNNYLELSDKRYLELKAREKVIVSWVKTIADKTGIKINLEDLEKAV
jgi:archaellum component FlaC